jgi:hypothetical protein
VECYEDLAEEMGRDEVESIGNIVIEFNHLAIHWQK